MARRLRDSRMRFVLAGAVCLVALLGVAPTASGASVADLPVAFQIRNTNSSGVPCPSDGAAYTVRGHLVAPSAALTRPQPRAVTLYVHGYNGGEWNYRFPLPGYDFAVEMARLGHISLTIDRLGFDSSGHPYGFDTCFGAHADMAHQIVQALRAGSYGVQGGRPLAFSKVVLSGHDLGGTIGEIEAYSYKDIDGLMVMAIGDGAGGYGPPSPSIPASAVTTERCALGGDPGEPAGPSGYARFFQTDREVRENGLRNSEQAVSDLVVKLVNRNPCGDILSTVPSFNVNSRRNGEIRVPILLLYTELDFNTFAGQPAEDQRALYTGSDDVSLVTMSNTGHFPMLDRNAPLFRSIVSDWLQRRGFGGGVVTSTSRRRLALALGIRPRSVRRGARTRFSFRVTATPLGVTGVKASPVAGAVVRFAGRRAVTDRRGRAAIVATLGRRGVWRARVSKPGVVGASATVLVTRGQRR